MRDLDERTINISETVCQIASRLPASTRVFGRHGIDFCCGGDVPLCDACAAHQLDVDRIVAEIQRELRPAEPTTLDGWADLPTEELIAHIVEHHHRPLDQELRRLEALANKVASVHQLRDERLAQLTFTLTALKAELEAHMLREERVLFPGLLSGDHSVLTRPIAVMLREHEDAGHLLEIVRGLTDDYTVPPHACCSWRALWHGLEQLDQSLREHIRFENNLLFPRAVLAQVVGCASGV